MCRQGLGGRGWSPYFLSTPFRRLGKETTSRLPLACGPQARESENNEGR